MSQLLNAHELENGCDYEGAIQTNGEELTMSATTHEKLVNANIQEARQFKRLYMAFFLIFLMVALVTRVLPAKWRPWSGEAVAKRSVVGEAKAAANTILPYVFMA